jgi:hypothetical protein
MISQNELKFSADFILIIHILRKKNNINIFWSEPWAEMIFGWSILCVTPPSSIQDSCSRNFKWQKKNRLKFSVKFRSQIENQSINQSFIQNLLVFSCLRMMIDQKMGWPVLGLTRKYLCHLTVNQYLQRKKILN